MKSYFKMTEEGAERMIRKMIHRNLKNMKAMCLVVGALLWLGSCTREDAWSQHIEDDGGVTLSVAVDLPQMVETRATDPAEEGIVPATAWNALVDGQVLYRLTAVLFREDLQGRKFAIAWRDLNYFDTGGAIYYDPSKGQMDGFERPATAASSTTFPFGFPTKAYLNFTHKRDKLAEGMYDVALLANWSACTIGQGGAQNSYAGLAGIDALVAQLKTEIDASQNGVELNLADTGSTLYKLFLNKGLVVGADGVCVQEPMPLSAIEARRSVIPGKNFLKSSLIRTRARVRIEVTNLSQDHYVNISKLEFGKIGQTDAYIFKQDSAFSKAPYYGTRSVIEVSSANAIVPFTVPAHPTPQEVVHIPGLSKSPNYENTRVIFDGYILESCLNGGEQVEDVYFYKIKLNHSINNNDQDAVPDLQDRSQDVYIFNDKSPISNAGNVKENQLYLLKNRNGYFLSEQNSQMIGVLAGSFEQADGKIIVPENCLWKWTRNQNGATTLSSESLATQGRNSFVGGEYLNTFGAEGKALTKEGFDGITFYYMVAGRYWNPDVYYNLAITGGAVRANRQERSQNTNNALFDLYKPISDKLSIPAKDVFPFQMQYINPDNNNKKENVTKIARNDFVRIRLGVRYNNQTGVIDFELLDWEDKREDIEFN